MTSHILYYGCYGCPLAMDVMFQHARSPACGLNWPLTALRTCGPLAHGGGKSNTCLKPDVKKHSCMIPYDSVWFCTFYVQNSWNSIWLEIWPGIRGLCQSELVQVFHQSFWNPWILGFPPSHTGCSAMISPSYPFISIHIPLMRLSKVMGSWGYP